MAEQNINLIILKTLLKKKEYRRIKAILLLLENAEAGPTPALKKVISENIILLSPRKRKIIEGLYPFLCSIVEDTKENPSTKKLLRELTMKYLPSDFKKESLQRSIFNDMTNALRNGIPLDIFYEKANKETRMVKAVPYDASEENHSKEVEWRGSTLPYIYVFDSEKDDFRRLIISRIMSVSTQ